MTGLNNNASFFLRNMKVLQILPGRPGAEEQEL